MNQKMSLVFIACLFPVGAVAGDMFLEPHEIALLQDVPGIEGMRNYTATNADPTDYSKVTIGSITFFFDEDSKAKDIDAEEMTAITAALKSAMEVGGERAP